MTLRAGDLVSYNAYMPMYVPGQNCGMGIVTRIDSEVIHIYSFAENKEIATRWSEVTLLSASANTNDKATI